MGNVQTAVSYRGDAKVGVTIIQFLLRDRSMLGK